MFKSCKILNGPTLSKWQNFFDIMRTSFGVRTKRRLSMSRRVN